MTMRYYIYDPNCAINKKWNGTDCIVDYDYFCSSLTDQYRVERNEPNLRVEYDGTSCVTIIPRTVDNVTVV